MGHAGSQSLLPSVFSFGPHDYPKRQPEVINANLQAGKPRQKSHKAPELISSDETSRKILTISQFVKGESKLFKNFNSDVLKI
jgi:hypothetical protein